MTRVKRSVHARKKRKATLALAKGYRGEAHSSYSKTYGSLGGIIVFLIWLWITNVVILLGAEFNSEMERSRQIHGGMRPHDKEPYLPMRDEPKET